MTCLASIGRLMAGSGVEQVLRIVFATNSVHHILAGKSVARAVRGHFLVDAVLTAIISSGINFQLVDKDSRGVEEGFQHNSNCTNLMQASGMTNISQESLQQEEIEKESCAEDAENTSSHCDIQTVLLLFEKVISRGILAEELTEAELEEIHSIHALVKAKYQLKWSRTSFIWLQYTEQIDILKRFVKAERTVDWKLH